MTDLPQEVERALLRRYYHIDPGELTPHQYRSLLLSIPKVEKLFRGDDKPLTTEDHAEWCQQQVREQEEHGR